MPASYVHGYHAGESDRLRDQAGTVADPFHADARYEAGVAVLEVGCGVGAQTVTLARHSPHAHINATDVSAESLAEAQRAARAAGVTNLAFRRADLLAPPFAPASFDHAFVCFVLEHVPRPPEALEAAASLVRPGGTMTVIEGDHATAIFHPPSAAAQAAIEALVTLQRRAGGDALIGRRLYPMLVGAGLAAVRVSPRPVYVDGSRPDLADGFTHRTFAAMVAGVRERAVAEGVLSGAAFDAGVRDLRRAAEPDGTFAYTFFKGTGTVPPHA